eukprot:TRINITY_DN3224_c0_g2_i1.p1 TRINITY_DN3224_c0_g2~~TRINITY_DN3224_c0_g2_i1.p1  ORF type:complete len:150 (-),score=33.71 TRINITY_DN3224_c0_g2_i1:1750-2199(-)
MENRSFERSPYYGSPYNRNDTTFQSFSSTPVHYRNNQQPYYQNRSGGGGYRPHRRSSSHRGRGGRRFSNEGGGNSGDSYYHPSMVEDPWSGFSKSKSDSLIPLAGSFIEESSCEESKDSRVLSDSCLEEEEEQSQSSSAKSPDNKSPAS